MSESSIRTQIKSVLESVSGIGIVHGYERYSRSLAEFFNLMTSSGKINGWTIHRQSTESSRDTMPTIQREHVYKISGLYELDDAANSENTFQGLLDAIYSAFKSNYNLNGTALNSDPVKIDNVDTEEYGNKLFHVAELTLIVQERDTYS
jgi:hypothetical protein